MTGLATYIDQLNRQGRKALSVFLTAGYPEPEGFVRLALDIFDAGADMLELGIPFSDPIADGPVIQIASQSSLAAGITIDKIFRYVRDIRRNTDKPIILMGYANPILRYGIKNFIKTTRDHAIQGIIVPDIPLEEYSTFWGSPPDNPDIIQLTTPTSSDERISAIDARSRGFVYCVSITGTTGSGTGTSRQTINHIRHTYRLMSRNKMLIGFGIAGASDVQRFAPYCDGVIVGSAVIKRLDPEKKDRKPDAALELVRELSSACRL